MGRHPRPRASGSPHSTSPTQEAFHKHADNLFPECPSQNSPPLDSGFGSGPTLPAATFLRSSAGLGLPPALRIECGRNTGRQLLLSGLQQRQTPSRAASSPAESSPLPSFAVAAMVTQHSSTHAAPGGTELSPRLQNAWQESHLSPISKTSRQRTDLLPHRPSITSANQPARKGESHPAWGAPTHGGRSLIAASSLGYQIGAFSMIPDSIAVT